MDITIRIDDLPRKIKSGCDNPWYLAALNAGGDTSRDNIVLRAYVELACVMPKGGMVWAPSLTTIYKISAQNKKEVICGG